MRNVLYRITQAVVLVAVAASFIHADSFTYIKKKTVAGGGSSPVWKMLVADAGNNRLVMRTGSMATYDNQVTTAGAGDNLSLPQNVSILGQVLFAVDSNNNRIAKYNLSNLVFILKAGSSGSGDNQVNYPLSILAFGDNVYISDTYNDRILVWLASDLSFVTKFGTTGAGDNNFSHPDGLATDGSVLLVADTYNHRIKKHNLITLAYIGEYFNAGVTPSGVATDGTYIWVTDINNNIVVKLLLSDMSYVDYCGSTQGSGDTQFSHPDGIAYDNGALYVADRDNSRISKWASSCSTTTGFLDKYGTNGTGNDQLDNTVYGVAIGYQQ